MAISSEYDYIVVGGGIAGSVVASRLHERLPHLSILLIEAGSDVTENPRVTEISNALNLRGSELDWFYDTLPQKHLNNRIVKSPAGKALGGGSAINYCERFSDLYDLCLRD
jgi:choline dehydrogenase-like flavoprotein